MAGRAAMPAKRAKAVMPIIGEIRIRRSGRARRWSSMASSAYFTASAPPLEKPTRCSGRDGPARRRASRTASRVAASQSSHSTSVKRGRHGAVCRHPDRHRDEAAVAIERARCGAGCTGESVSPCSRTTAPTGGPVGLEDVRAVPVLGEVAGIDRAAREVAVDRCPRLVVDLVDDLGPHLAKRRLLGLEVGGPVGLVDLARHASRAARGCARDRAAAHAGNPRRAPPAARRRPRAGARARGAAISAFCGASRSRRLESIHISAGQRHVCIRASVLGRTAWSGDAGSIIQHVTAHKMPA